MEISLKDSYSICERVAKSQAKNFYYAFTVLPKPKRQAICAMYAFMRYCDDISDSEILGDSKVSGLQMWRNALVAAMEGEYGKSDIMPAFHDTVVRFGIPVEYFHELIDGAEMDLSINRYATFDDLYKYCYRVASVVGLVCIYIFGFKDEEAKKYAESCGIAFQLTNVIRDVKEDAERNRIYLPMEDLQSFGYPEADLLNGVMDDRFRSLIKFEVDRASGYYQRSLPLLSLVDPSSRPGLSALIGIYSTLLRRIADKDYDVLSGRVSLSTKEKLGIAAKSFLGSGLPESEQPA